MKVVILVVNVVFLQCRLRNPMYQSRVKLLGIRHNQFENIVSESLIFLFVLTLLVHVVMNTEIHIHSMHIWMLSDEIGVDLLLFGVIEHLLDEPLEVFGQIFVLFDRAFDFINVFLRVH